VWWQSALPVFFALLVYKDDVAARRWVGWVRVEREVVACLGSKKLAI
jgi:hypothetical protein